MSVTGTYLDGSIVLDEPLALANGEHVRLVLTVAEEDCADGSRWPLTKSEVEAWCRRIEDLPALFDTEAETAAFEARLQATRREQIDGLADHAERVDKLFGE